jgi:hypothetical protein
MLTITYIDGDLVMITPTYKKYFENFLSKNWQHRKFISIFASQNKQMQRRLELHIETSNRFSRKVGYAVCGACSATE